ncbi:hypothetical protein EI94DRAFT_1718917 [Lactarius quietus]|nr:hypothetical protein EI94DRAFT_1718917 [Lactarius quietus]
MSGAPREAINVHDAGIGNDRYPSQLAQNQTSHVESSFVDDSEPIFSMYLEMAEEEDKKLAEKWQANADGILIFTGLFSAAVASLISDTSNFYLANIYQTLADPDRFNVSGSLTSSPPSFTPPTSAIWVNTLCISCALLATLLQQWARRYLTVTQPHYSIAKRARIRAFFAEGVEKFVLLWVAESLPTLLHTSLFLFFAGLVVFLCNLTLAWIGFCSALYGCVTFAPIFYHDCPYYTPYTIFFWQVAIGILDIIYQVRWSFGSPRLRRRVALGSLRDHYHKLNMQGMHKTAEGTALNAPSEIDTRAFMWTFDSLDEDHELERFFSGLPGFRKSRVVVDPLLSLKDEQKQKFSEALKWLLDVTFSSDSLPNPVKKRRAIICAKAVDPAHIPDSFGILHRILSHYQYTGPLATEIMQIVRSWGNITDEDAILDAQVAVSTIVARVQPRDDSWLMLAASALGVPEFVLREYAATGDSLSLAILIHLTRQQFGHYGKPSWPSVEFSEILEAASNFNVEGASPKLQHEFCALWNEIVRNFPTDNDQSMAFEILGPIRTVHIALHQDDIHGVPSSYLECNVAGHIHHSAPTTFPRPVHYNNAALAPASHASPQAISMPVPAPHHIGESLTDTSPLDNDHIYVPGSFHPAHQTAIENLRMPAPSPDPVTTCVIQYGASVASSPTSMASPCSPGAVAVQHITGRRTSPDVQGVPTLPSRDLVVDNMFPTESHSSLSAPAVPGPSLPLLSSAPDLSAAAEGEGSAKAALHERNALDSPSAIRGTIMAAPDLPPRPSPSSVTNVTSAGPSPRSEKPGDQPLRHSHGLYDIG